MQDRTGYDYSPNDPEQIEDPCPFLRFARAECPVFYSSRHGGFWTVTRYKDIWEASHDKERFTSAVIGVTMPQKVYERQHPYIPVETDDPLHSEYRNIIAPLFAPSAVLRLEPEIKSIARELLGEFTGEIVDLVQDFALPMVSRVLMLAMGMPVADAPVLVDIMMRIFHDRVADRALWEDAQREFDEYLSREIRLRVEHPRDENDLFSRLVMARIDGGRSLEPWELHMYGAQIFTAGFETTINGIGTSLWYLTQNSAVRSYLVQNPSRISRAVEEFLRYFAPVQLFGRNATQAFEYGGQHIASGDSIFLHYGSGNRDADVFDSPDDFDPDRWPNRHLAFGSGIHFCVGAHLARLEMRVALDEVLKAYPDFELAEEPGLNMEWTSHGDLRGIWHLPVALMGAAAEKSGPNSVDRTAAGPQRSNRRRT